jgi:hypothetical protein
LGLLGIPSFPGAECVTLDTLELPDFMKEILNNMVQWIGFVTDLINKVLRGINAAAAQLRSILAGFSIDAQRSKVDCNDASVRGLQYQLNELFR